MRNRKILKVTKQECTRINQRKKEKKKIRKALKEKTKKKKHVEVRNKWKPGRMVETKQQIRKRR